ncbi:uncharacterized protein A4U43_C01F13860 [Asparagus officinalis]|uniref:Uncharacterized protein n=1 Tax=Asparagus officinalis TaxID=4686 RepID=A0A5P1FRN7_ASPOF|nr:uncharacterized protein LOC109822795 [Asparagus officinalis]ONK80097.1 uncharacterized protein A4U43_C01F13860 [Asparagus officinalis]
MAGIALILDLLKKKQTLTTQSIHPYTLFPATAAATAASIAAGKPFLSRALFGDGGIPIAYCDAGVTLDERYTPNLRGTSETVLHEESIKFKAKDYPIELKPLFSAFGLKSLAMTSVRSFLLFYLPLLEPHQPADDDDDDVLQEIPGDRPVDLVVPFKNSVKQIFRETAVVTTRRVLERLSVHYVSQRMARKLLKDVSKSAKRKAARGLPTTLFVYNVSRTTFRGHMLGVAASWVVQIIIEAYRCLIRKPVDENGDIPRREKIRLLAKKIYGASIKCGSSLVFASIGAGIGALFHPSTGQWIGCAIGDFAGPVVAIVCFEKLNLEL